MYTKEISLVFFSRYFNEERPSGTVFVSEIVGFNPDQTRTDNHCPSHGAQTWKVKSASDSLLLVTTPSKGETILPTFHMS